MARLPENFPVSDMWENFIWSNATEIPKDYGCLLLRKDQHTILAVAIMQYILNNFKGLEYGLASS